MQKLFITFISSMLSWAAAAQVAAPRYVFVEHVTNSRCSVCASRNPAMYTLLEQNASQVHHLAYHPSFPYSNCIFYQANTSENNARAAFYEVSSTPKVILNGTLVGPAAQLLPANVLNPQLNQTSAIYVQVTETANQVNVTVHTIGDKPEGNYELYVALAEKTVNYNAPNGENVHHDVFRDMLSNIEGDAVTLAASGAATSFTFAKTTNTNWNTDEIYAIAWVQNTQTKEILNSGTKFDAVVSGTNEIASEPISFSPNPTTGKVIATITDDIPQSVAVYSLTGALVSCTWTINGNNLIEIDLDNTEAGIYFIQIRGEKQTFTGKLAKVE